MLKRKLLSVSVFLCISVLFGATLAAQTGQKEADGIARNGAPVKKLSATFEKIAELYRTQPKLTPEALSKALLAGSLEHQAKFAGSSQVLPVDERAMPKGNSFVEDLIDPVLQKRWGDPDFDVLNCNIEFTGDVEALKGYNAKFRSVLEYQGRNVGIVEIAGPELARMAKDSRVIRISPILRDEVNNDLGANATGAARLRLWGPGEWEKGYTGKGVIVGDIDTGIDWTHEDFIDPATDTSRILYMWDTQVTTAGKTPAAIFGGSMAGLTYGTVYTKAEIDAGLVPASARDTNGHGTHTIGTAAGNGYATGKYTGMAPNADIIFVKGLDNNGNVFIYELAKRLGKPCSVNMSYGPTRPVQYMAIWTSDFPGDGSDPDSQFFAAINNYYGGGHIPNKSMGNEGHWDSYYARPDIPYKVGGFHAGGALNQTRTYTFNIADYTAVWQALYHANPFYTAANNCNYPYIDIGVWYDRPVRITMEAPNGDVFGPFAHGTHASISANDSAWMEYTFNNAVEANGGYTGLIHLEWNVLTGPYAACPMPGNWTISVEPITPGSGYLDMWAVDFRIQNGGAFYAPWANDVLSTFRSANKYEHLSMYCMDETMSPHLIGVAAYNTRENWKSVNGNIYSWGTKPILNHIAEFSSPGPARNRYLKPDIAAPGNIILSALSPWCGSPTPLIADSGKHQAMSGTSMSCPHVTGAVALMLQKAKDMGRPWPTVEDVRRNLQAWARNDQWTALYGRNAFGAGKMNLLPLNEYPVSRVSVDKPQISLTNVQTATFDASGSSDFEKFPMNYKWRVISAPAGATYTFTPGKEKAQLLPDARIPGTYQIGLTANDGIWDGEEAVATVEAVNPADIAVTKTAAAAIAIVNEPFVYTITARNLGPGAAANLKVSDVLPSGLSYVSAVATQGAYDSGSGTWDVGTLANGATVTLQLTVKPTAEGNVTNTARVLSVSASDPNSANNTSSVIVEVSAVYPPSNVKLERVENNMIFYKEIVNKITWQANALNKTAITKYKIYRKAKGAADTTYQVAAELAGTVYQFLDRKLQNNQMFTYKVTAVNDKGKESQPVVVSN